MSPRFRHLVFKTNSENSYNSLICQGISAKRQKFKNEQKCAEIYRNARVLNRIEQVLRTF